jgi:hypothetical protein
VTVSFGVPCEPTERLCPVASTWLTSRWTKVGESSDASASAIASAIASLAESGTIGPSPEEAVSAPASASAPASVSPPGVASSSPPHA